MRAREPQLRSSFIRAVSTIRRAAKCITAWTASAATSKSPSRFVHIETTVNNDTFPWFIGYMQKPEPQWNIVDNIGARINKHFLDCTPLSLNRKIFFSVKAPYAVTGIHAGETEPVHKITLQNVYKQQLIEVQGQSDILVCPIPYTMPYSVHSIMNPILVYSMGLGYMFNFYKNQPVVKKGGTIIFIHPLENKFNKQHHPSYIDLFERIKQTRDPKIVDTWSDELANNPRTSKPIATTTRITAFTRFDVEWGVHATDHVGQIITVNPQSPEAAAQLGWQTAPTVEAAIAMGRDRLGANASVSVLHSPPIAMWEVK